MYFDTFGELLNMSGHGSYVWFSYGVSVVVLGSLIFVARRRRKQTEQHIRAIVRRKQESSSTIK